jgi:hypothetical protein
MVLLFHVRQGTIPGPSVHYFRCPVCEQETGGQAFEYVEVLRLFFLLPVLTFRNTYVKCASCGTSLRTVLKVHELEQYADSDLSPYLSHQVSIVLKVLTLIAFLLCWFPWLGLVLSVLDFLVARKARGWVHTLTMFNLAVSIVMTIALSLLLIVGKILGW